MIRRVGPFPHPLPGQSAATVQYDGFATPAPGPGNITFDGANTYLYDLETKERVPGD